jgi:hypothetical protein
MFFFFRDFSVRGKQQRSIFPNEGGDQGSEAERRQDQEKEPVTKQVRGRISWKGWDKRLGNSSSLASVIIVTTTGLQTFLEAWSCSLLGKRKSSLFFMKGF